MKTVEQGMQDQRVSSIKIYAVEENIVDKMINTFCSVLDAEFDKISSFFQEREGLLSEKIETLIQDQTESLR